MRMFKMRFKRLTLFDRVLIALAVLGTAFLAYFFFRKSTYVTATIKVSEENVNWGPTYTRSWFSQLFYEGMKEQDGLGRIMSEVVSIRSYDTGSAIKAVYLTTRLRAVYSRASNQHTFKGTPLSIGSPVRLNLDRLLVEGLVTHVEGVKDPRVRENLIVEAQVREETPTFPEASGTREYIADALKVGDEVKDSRGNVIIKVLSKRVENAKRLVTTSDGRTLIQTNSLRKDVYLTLEVNAVKIGERYFLFDDVPILIGQTIPFNTPTISIFPEITKINIGE